MLSGCRIIDLPKIPDHRGNLTFIEGLTHIPFEIKRAYYIYDVPGGETRGGHAHKNLQEFLIAISGSFEVVLDDGAQKKNYFLSRAYYGLYIPTMIWREIVNFSTGSVCLVLASLPYDESDYYRNYGEFLKDVKEKSSQ